MSSSIWLSLSKYMLAAINFVFPLIISTETVSASDSWCINITSICLLVTTTAALHRSSPDVKILYFVEIPLLCPG